MRSWSPPALLALAPGVLAACGCRASPPVPPPHRGEPDEGEARPAGPRWVEPDVPALIKGLADPDQDVRSYAALTLSRLGPKAEPAVPALTRALKDNGEHVRSSAAQALGQVGRRAS